MVFTLLRAWSETHLKRDLKKSAIVSHKWSKASLPHFWVGVFRINYWPLCDWIKCTLVKNLFCSSFSLKCHQYFPWLISPLYHLKASPSLHHSSLSLYVTENSMLQSTRQKKVASNSKDMTMLWYRWKISPIGSWPKNYCAKTFCSKIQIIT